MVAASRAVIPAKAGTHDKHQVLSANQKNEEAEATSFYRSLLIRGSLSIVPAFAGMTAVGRLAERIIAVRPGKV
jgi:hypothetical protein